MKNSELILQTLQKAIAIDGKELRGSFDKAAKKSNLNLVTAFAHGARLSLGITQSAKAGSEILALRELIQLDIRGITLTADALHCQRETCELIAAQGAEYCIQLRANQKGLMNDIQTFIADPQTTWANESVPQMLTTAVLRSAVIEFMRSQIM